MQASSAGGILMIFFRLPLPLAPVRYRTEVEQTENGSEAEARATRSGAALVARNSFDACQNECLASRFVLHLAHCSPPSVFGLVSRSSEPPASSDGAFAALRLCALGIGLAE